jgi:hypothetical protein
MDEDAVLMAIGKLQGQVEGLGREIKTLTIAVGEGSTAMQAKHEALIIRVADLELNGAKISRLRWPRYTGLILSMPKLGLGPPRALPWRTS